jgi:poly(A) polymerase
MTEREFAIHVVKCLQEAGHQALWAGGCVRDELLGLVPKDYDVATDALPEEVRKLFRRTVAVGLSFGVVEVLGPRQNPEPLCVQVATFRSDVSYSDGRRPDQVVFSSAREDALRRDFTINGMFFDPLKNELIDYVDGQKDLANRLLRAIGEPEQRFTEDKLRMMRAVRIATRFQLQIEPATAAAIRQMAPQIHVVSAERIADELHKLLVEAHRVHGLELMDDLRLTEPVLPELLPLRNTPCAEGQAGNLWEHTLRVLGRLGPAPEFPLALAALLHEVGRPRTTDPHKAIALAADMTEEIALRLRLSNAEKDRAVWLVEHQQSLRPAQQLRLCQLKRLLVHPAIEELLVLHQADALAEGQSVAPVEFCRERLRVWTEEDLNPPPLLTGHDLAALGLKQGPLFKRLLDEVRDAQLDGAIQTREEALELVQRLLPE